MCGEHITCSEIKHYLLLRGKQLLVNDSISQANLFYLFYQLYSVKSTDYRHLGVGFRGSVSLLVINFAANQHQKVLIFSLRGHVWACETMKYEGYAVEFLSLKMMYCRFTYWLWLLILRHDW